MYYLLLIAFIAACVMALLMTPVVKQFALKIGAVDAPNHRKVHTRIMPRLGGLAIFLAFVGAYFVIESHVQDKQVGLGLLIGGAIIVLVGALDDKYELSAKVKLLGQIIAASVVVFVFDIRVDLVNVPFGGTNIDIGWLSIPLTLFWIVGVTNAINLIDGLDGLAGGVSAIATGTIFVMALIMGNVTVILLSMILLGSIIGFLFFNFHPAKIFMGDSGALFLGFCLATLSILGYKQATLVSFIIPLLVFGVPLSDTFFAIVRRIVNKKPISVADKGHLHHCLLRLGFTHRTTVLIIYGVAAFFGLCAVLLSQISQTTLWGAMALIILILIVLQLGAEAIGIVGKRKKPVLRFLLRLHYKTLRLSTRYRTSK